MLTEEMKKDFVKLGASYSTTFSAIETLDKAIVPYTA
jgi:hypothetical protein